MSQNQNIESDIGSIRWNAFFSTTALYFGLRGNNLYWRVSPFQPPSLN